MCFKIRCGLVALCMALNSLEVKCNIDELMGEAKKLNYTKNGEIFDSKYMIYLNKIFNFNK
jgi:hypothetical protein